VSVFVTSRGSVLGLHDNLASVEKRCRDQPQLPEPELVALLRSTERDDKLQRCTMFFDIGDTSTESRGTDVSHRIHSASTKQLCIVTTTSRL
jgi:hypothetical protein